MQDESANVVDLRGGLIPSRAGPRRSIRRRPRLGAGGAAARSRRATGCRFQGYMAEIFTTFGMEPDTPGTERSPERFLKALYDATAGYEGDAKLLTAFPTECRCDADCLVSQVIEGPISVLRALRAPRAAFPRLRPRRLRRARADHRHLEADPAGAPVRAPLHRAGAPRRADRGRARRADGAARRRRPSRGRAPVHADARRPRGALEDGHERLARRLQPRTRSCGASSSPRSATATPGHERRESEASDGHAPAI